MVAHRSRPSFGGLVAFIVAIVAVRCCVGSRLPTPSPTSLSDLLAAQQRNNIVVLTWFDKHYKPLAKPWYKNSVRLGLPNVLMITLDAESQQTAMEAELPSISIECALVACKPLTLMEEGGKPIGFELGAGGERYHFKISVLRAVADLGYHIFMSEMDIILQQNPLTTAVGTGREEDACVHESVRLGDVRSLSRDMWISSHCDHPRINIGFGFLVNSTAVRGFLQQLERNWQAARTWDQPLWDAMLRNTDTLKHPPYNFSSESVTLGKLSPRFVADWTWAASQHGFQSGRCTQRQCVSPLVCREVVAWHLDGVRTEARRAALSYAYGVHRLPKDRLAAAIVKDMCHFSVRSHRSPQ